MNSQPMWGNETVFILKDNRPLHSFLTCSLFFQILSVIWLKKNYQTWTPLHWFSLELVTLPTFWQSPCVLHIDVQFFSKGVTLAVEYCRKKIIVACLGNFFLAECTKLLWKFGSRPFLPSEGSMTDCLPHFVPQAIFLITKSGVTNIWAVCLRFKHVQGFRFVFACKYRPVLLPVGCKVRLGVRK